MFNPYGKITRVQLAQILARMARQFKGYPERLDGPAKTFADVPGHAANDVDLVARLGLMTGYLRRAVRLLGQGAARARGGGHGAVPGAAAVLDEATQRTDAHPRRTPCDTQRWHSLVDVPLAQIRARDTLPLEKSAALA